MEESVEAALSFFRICKKIYMMYVACENAGETWYDIKGNRSASVTINSNGMRTAVRCRLMKGCAADFL
ncbi:hypothetical protein P4U97_11290 [Bacillus swezeyi]|uniref:hypothetical protein n=1 Tax=Bacillus swezeyi TaxID=1925020 RepID=UPI002E1E8C7B|nr:hypothetical protein [Bacillus swezeyi]